MGKFYTLFSTLLIAVGYMAASNPVGYEWWFDNDISSSKTGTISGEMLDMEIDMSDVTAGTHYFNLRLNDSDGVWGSSFRKMVFTSGSGIDAIGYEYWIDDNYLSKVQGTLSNESNVYTVNLEGVSKGLHRFNYRIHTGAGEWGSVYSKYFFYYTSNNTPITKYEYWLDNDYDNRVIAQTSTNQIIFDIDLSAYDKSGEFHYFNMRMRDDDGDWSTFYRKLIMFYNNDTSAPIIGYRHSFNGTDLGFVSVERRISDSYTFEFDLPDDFGFSISDKKPIFNGNIVSVEGNDSIHYKIQIQTEKGWTPPSIWDFEATGAFSTNAVEMEINTNYKFNKPKKWEFSAIKFSSLGQPLYFYTDQPISMDIYKDGEKVECIQASDLVALVELTLSPGEYFGILHDAEYEGEGEYLLNLLDTPNIVPTPLIEFADGKVSISCSRENAEIYYTLDDSQPTTSSIKYIEPFSYDHNGVIKAFAILPDSDLAPSDIAELVVNSYTVSDPKIGFENLMVVIDQDQREGVRTFYTLDGKEPTQDSELYTAPFSVSESLKVLARSFKDNFNPSNIIEYAYNHDIYLTAAPNFTLTGNLLTLTAVTEGSVLYYSIGNSDSEAMSLYEGPITVSGNLTIYAQARKNGMYDSEVVSFTLTNQKTDIPYGNFDKETKMLTLLCNTEGAVISFTFDQNDDWKTYSSPILIEGNRTVYAKALASDYLESEIAEIIISELKCQEAEFSYNGRYLTISTVEPSSQIYYSINGDNPITGEIYSGKIDVTGCGPVKAVIIKSGYMNSDTSELEIKYYADEEHAVTTEGGLLKECFGWTNNDWIESIEEFTVEGELNKADYATLQSFKSLRHLDLTKVHSDTIPAGVFSGLPLVSISMPRSIGEYGNLIFNGNKHLCAIIWNSEDLAVDSKLLNGVDNPNLLVYFPNQTSVSDAFTSGANKIVADHTGIIKLKDGYPFFAPRAFNTEEISYTRNFSKETVIGTSSGWESLTVPFDVEEIKDANGVIKPFEISKDESDRPFWLYSPEASGWLASAGINAYEPYIIAMPFSSDYIEEFNIHGDVTFVARQATIMASGESEPFSYKSGSQMWPNFSYLPVADNLWVINDDWNEGNAPGSTFVRGLRDVRPFECFLTSVDQRRMPIFDSSDINGILSESDFKVWSENNAICITSGKDRTVNIFDTVGQLVRIVEIPGGETVRVKDLAPGIYLAGRFKVLLR